MTETLNTLAHALTAVVIAVVGWFVNRQVALKDKFEAAIREKFHEVEMALKDLDEGGTAVVKDLDVRTAAALKDLDIRAQLAEVQRAMLDTKSEAQAIAIAKFQEDISDIRENMVRRADLDALVGQITGVRRPRRS